MSERFFVGEVAIFWSPGSENHGKEVIVAGPLRYTSALSTKTGEILWHWSHRVEGDLVTGPFRRPGYPIGVCVNSLRKKRPPREDWKIVSWDTCPWQPESVRHGT